MYELVQAGKNTYYIDCPSKIGLYRMNETDICLIDSGNDKDAGKRILRILENQGFKLNRIIHTHSHGDHMGGSRFLAEKTGCLVFTPGIEEAFVREPLLEPAFLYGGYPASCLRNKFLCARACVGRELTADDLPFGLTALRLDGHSFAQTAVKTEDQVWFLADSLTGQEILDKYGIPFLYDVKAYLNSLDTVKTLEGCLFIPSHGKPQKEVRSLADGNILRVRENISLLLRLCEEALGPEEILQKVFERFGLNMDFNQYVLVGSTVRSYLSYMKDQGMIRAEFSQNRLLWTTEKESRQGEAQ